MDEQKKENLPENTEAENSLKDTPEQEKTAQPAGRSILWVLAGIYLLYTGYSLIRAVVKGEDGSTPVFLLIGIAFLAIGAGLVFVAGKNVLKSNSVSKAKEAGRSAGMAGADGAAGSELKPEETAGQKKMSIADRANLAKRLDEEENSAGEKEENQE